MTCAIRKGCENSSAPCGVAQRDEFLQIHTTDKSTTFENGWADAVDRALRKVEERHRKERPDWIISLKRNSDTVVISNDGREIARNRSRRDRFTPLAPITERLLKQSKQENHADHTLFLILSDGLNHPSATEGQQLDAFHQIVNTIPLPVSVLFARLTPLSHGEDAANTTNMCRDLKSALSAKTNQVQFSCTQQNIDTSFNIASFTPRKPECYQFPIELNAELQAHKYAKVLHDKLHDVVYHYVLKLSEEVGEAHSRYESRYTAIQTAPPDIADGVIVGNEYAWRCSGVAVAEDVIVTAAHCLPATRLMITNDVATGGTVHEMASVARHPNADVDVALLKTKSKFTDKPAQLRNATDHDPPMGVLRVIGFGTTDASDKGTFGKKHFVDLQAAGWGCDGERAERTGCKPGLEMVLPGSVGRDTCYGDSGGPVYELWGDGVRCGYRLVGITVRRTADSVLPCGNGGIYTRIDVVRDWIDQQIAIWQKEGSRGEEQ